MVPSMHLFELREPRTGINCRREPSSHARRRQYDKAARRSSRAVFKAPIETWSSWTTQIRGNISPQAALAISTKRRLRRGAGHKGILSQTRSLSKTRLGLGRINWSVRKLTFSTGPTKTSLSFSLGLTTKKQPSHLCLLHLTPFTTQRPTRSVHSSAGLWPVLLCTAPNAPASTSTWKTAANRLKRKWSSQSKGLLFMPCTFPLGKSHKKANRVQELVEGAVVAWTLHRISPKPARLVTSLRGFETGAKPMFDNPLIQTCLS